VADERSFTRAAQRCHVSQPPLSRAIAQLEAELGLRLFDRDTHSVALTEAGAALVQEARRGLALLEAGAAKARQTAAGQRGTLVIGFGGSIVYSLLPALVRQFRAAAPDVEIRFRPMAVLRQIDALRAGEIDLGILRMPVFDELIHTQPVHREQLVAALPTGHPLLAVAGPIELGALANSRFVTYEPSRGFQYHADLLSLCRLRDFVPAIAHEAPTTEAVVGIVACGEGVALVPTSAERLRMRGVTFRPLATQSLPTRLTTVEFALAWRRESPSSVTLEFAACAAAWQAAAPA
jgi:DNA-binding transcriptional LysR family regulator